MIQRKKQHTSRHTMFGFTHAQMKCVLASCEAVLKRVDTEDLSVEDAINKCSQNGELPQKYEAGWQERMWKTYLSS